MHKLMIRCPGIGNVPHGVNEGQRATKVRMGLAQFTPDPGDPAPSSGYPGAEVTCSGELSDIGARNRT